MLYTKESFTRKANKILTIKIFKIVYFIKTWLTVREKNNIKGVKTSRRLSGNDSHIDSKDDDDSRNGQMLRWVEQNSKLVKKREGWEMGVNMPPLSLLPFFMSSCRVSLSSLFLAIPPSDHFKASFHNTSY